MSERGQPMIVQAPVDDRPLTASTAAVLRPAAGAGRRVDVRTSAGKSTLPRERPPVPWQLQARVVRPRGLHRAEIAGVRERQADWLLLTGAADAATRAALRARLVGQGLELSLREEALACVAAKAHRALGRDPSDAQLQCTQGLLDGWLLDMADGEGKSLAVALAAAAFALTGEPVHVLVANDFLAARDARQHVALFVGLGLRVGIVTSQSTPAQRKAAYLADVVYGTAQDIARDHLRDSHRAMKGDAAAKQGTGVDAAQASLFPRGLCCAFVDDADVVLLDEATTPLDLVEVHEDPDLHAACIVALAVARRVRLDVDAVIDVADCCVDWTDVGLARIELLSKPLGDGWQGRPDRHDLLSQALVALHALHAGHDYLLREDRIELLAPVQAHDGERQEWPRTLQTLLEIKEGCRPSPMLRTLARTRLQKFFTLYKHLAGTAAALSDGADDLTALYGLRVVDVPRSQRSRLRLLPHQVFEAACTREAAAVQRIKALLSEKRAVLVGVSSDGAAAALSAALQAAGIEGDVTDGRDEAQDAQRLEQAGRPGAVTILTERCGRGVFIPVPAELAAVGGLHVLDMLDTPCARTRRQFLGRAACRGAPGSAETWHAADMPCWDRSWIDLPVKGAPQWMIETACRMQQLVHRWSVRRERRRLLAEQAAP